MSDNLSPAAKRDLEKLRNGWDGKDIRYGPWRQLKASGHITGEQGERLKLKSEFDSPPVL